MVRGGRGGAPDGSRGPKRRSILLRGRGEAVVMGNAPPDGAPGGGGGRVFARWCRAAGRASLVSAGPGGGGVTDSLEWPPSAVCERCAPVVERGSRASAPPAGGAPPSHCGPWV